ncbi:hypothetical protein L0U88_20460 [Flavihumibacter sp. RY-1]|uniref:Uncharacterized protein n=1 Tax=Flavihumibacter fluminis TaxID=2909236 RepID=A0ABS9BMS5_9BACT|nr:hypothetical protein [Flavihumibacter fluminis]MCF1717027.1 hypothetical protein [Flavihumibacter fluminis]
MTLFAGCSFLADTSDEDRLQNLYRQRVANSPLVIYDFSFAGGFVTSSDHTGFAILDSTVSFSKDKMNELPCTYFAAVPTNTVFEMIDINYGQNPRTEKDTLLTPTNHYSKKVGNLQINVSEYKDTYGSATSSTGLMEYEFDIMRETSDSLTFYNVTKKFGGKEFPATTSFVKGNIKVVDSTEGSINYIDVDQVIIKRGDTYKPTKPLELVSNQPIVDMATYRFYPRKAIKTATLTDYGIFKRMK